MILAGICLLKINSLKPVLIRKRMHMLRLIAVVISNMVISNREMEQTNTMLAYIDFKNSVLLFLKIDFGIKLDGIRFPLF